MENKTRETLNPDFSNFFKRIKRKNSINAFQENRFDIRQKEKKIEELLGVFDFCIKFYKNPSGLTENELKLIQNFFQNNMENSYYYKPQSVFNYTEIPIVKSKTGDGKKVNKIIVTANTTSVKNLIEKKSLNQKKRTAINNLLEKTVSSKNESDQNVEYDSAGNPGLTEEQLKGFLGLDFLKDPKLQKEPDEGIFSIEQGFEFARTYALRGRLPVKISSPYNYYNYWYSKLVIANKMTEKRGGSGSLTNHSIEKKTIPVIVEWRPQNLKHVVLDNQVLYKTLENFYNSGIFKNIRNLEISREFFKKLEELETLFNRNGKYLSIYYHRENNGTLLPKDIYPPGSNKRVNNNSFVQETNGIINKLMEEKRSGR